MDSNTPGIVGEAIRLAASGRPVFPCRPNKTPYTPRGFKDATTNADAIRRMFSGYDDATIGMRCGGGVVVIDTDLDPESGKDGEAALAALPELPDTYKVRTPRGGHHRYFTIPDGIVLPCSADKLARGVDVRGDGGYVLAPPSRTERGAYEVVAAIPMAMLPDAWVDLIVPPEPRRPQIDYRAMATTPPRGTDVPVWETWEKATSWADILIPQGWARGRTVGENTHWTRPGKDEGTSATTKGEDGPLYVFSSNSTLEANQAYSKRYVYATFHHGGDMAAACRAMVAQGHGTNANALDISRHRAPASDPIDEALGSATPEPEPEADEFWTVETLRAYTVDPTHYLVGDGWMRRQAVTLLVGMTGIGKSVLATQMAASIAVGRDILGKLSVPKPLKVVVIQAENDPDTMKRDLCAVADALNLDNDELAMNLRMYHKPGMTPLLLGAMMERIHDEYPFDVVVLDNYMSYCGGDINSTETFFEFRGAVESPLHRIGAGCLLLTHPPKPMRGEGGAPRHAREIVYNAAGTSALANWVRTSAELALAGQEDKRCVLRFSKNAERTGLRDQATGEIIRKLYLERSDYVKPYWRIAENQGEAATGGYDEELESLWRQEPLLSVREAAERVGCGKSTAAKVYARLKQNGFQPRDTDI